MEYFSPKTFLKFSTVRKNYWRLGQFFIDPVNNQYNHEMYWIYSIENDDGKYYTEAANKDFLITSPLFLTEEKAIRWLEKQLTKLAQKKINQLNKSLLKQIKDNQKFINNLK